MKRASRQIFSAALFGAVLALGPAAVRAADSDAPPPVNQATLPSASAGATCDPAADAERNRKREEALAELGQRLSQQQKSDPDFQVLNRTGQNYDGSPVSQE